MKRVIVEDWQKQASKAQGLMGRELANLCAQLAEKDKELAAVAGNVTMERFHATRDYWKKRANIAETELAAARERISKLETDLHGVQCAECGELLTEGHAKDCAIGNRWCGQYVESETWTSQLSRPDRPCTRKPDHIGSCRHDPAVYRKAVEG